VSELNTSDNDSFPALSSDGLTLLFSSTRADGGAKGGYDIWIAKRPSVDQAFGPPRNLVELNTPDAEYANFLSQDDCTLYFHRMVAGVNRVYFAERPR
jgi:Tol biopolymer transport system component